jgi:hypothetical protein
MTRPLVMPRLDPGIHAVLPTLGHFVDCGIKPGNDGHRAGS